MLLSWRTSVILISVAVLLCVMISGILTAVFVYKKRARLSIYITNVYNLIPEEVAHFHKTPLHYPLPNSNLKIPGAKANFAKTNRLYEVALNLKSRGEVTFIQGRDLEKCDKKISLRSSFTAHVSRKHRTSTFAQLWIMDTLSEQPSSAFFDVTEDEVDESEFTDSLTKCNAKSLYMNNLCLFYMQLQAKYLVPSSTIQMIVEEFSGLNDICHQYTQKMFREILNMYLGRDENRNQRYAQYIPLKNSLKTMLIDPVVWEQCAKHQHVHSSVFSDICDGSVFKSNDLFKQPEITIQFILYQDAFEIVNPLGDAVCKAVETSLLYEPDFVSTRVEYKGDSSCETSFYDHDWHYSFDVPWQKMPASFMEKLQNGERPSCSEKRQLVRIVASEILEVSKCPAKKHVSEIARQMVIAYPKSFRDEINSQVVGSGYDSLLKQLPAGMKAHFKELTGIDINNSFEESASRTVQGDQGDGLLHHSHGGGSSAGGANHLSRGSPERRLAPPTYLPSGTAAHTVGLRVVAAVVCVRPYASPGREVGFAGHSPVECAIGCKYTREEPKNSALKRVRIGDEAGAVPYRPIRAVAVKVRARCCSPWGLPVSVPSREKVADGVEVSPSISASGVPPVGAQEPEPMSEGSWVAGKQTSPRMTSLLLRPELDRWGWSSDSSESVKPVSLRCCERHLIYVTHRFRMRG
ncbi:hypothetical protein E1301_Tti022476 [Triplophysa tibetana]|uniref:Uncharacterized protein n=1 Tax=Triplophysa tibetana TaxID=1572043 RepID=A0A5A9MVG8_9TELE|nr:hypothetical protein E1301_Tti022476 [Triplophysa tibetana]